MDEMNASAYQNIRLNDRLIRIIGVPSFGIIIPNLTGLFGQLGPTDLAYWIGYLYFILLAGLIWEGNRYLLFRTRKRFTWFERPIEKLVLLFMNNVFYTSPLTAAWLCIWYPWAGFTMIGWDTILVVMLVNVICVLFITHVYETVFMVKEQQSEQVRSAELLRAKAIAELAALKNQVDPHFMFNSLNTLSHLIGSDATKALQFTENLADVYRYILSQKDQTLVLLGDELEFTQKYTGLLYLRFGKALIVHRNFDATREKEFLIPPTSVFIALENAVKHNEISERNPMRVELHVEGLHLVIRNTVRHRTANHSTKIVLKNLDERFRLATGSGITAAMNEAEQCFEITLPLIPLNQ